jgi:secreted trypsin-like serine protease
LIQRSSKEDGFACNGDSGGPIVVENSGRFVLAAVVSQKPKVRFFSSWPPFCMCNCQGEPESHAKVSVAIPWIDQVMEEINLSFTCKENFKF